MKVETPAGRSAQAPTAGVGPRGLLAVVFATAALSAVGTFAAAVRYLVPDPGQRLWKWSETRGNHFYRDLSLKEAVFQAPKLMLESTPALPHLVIDIKFKHMQKISGKREEALRRGILVTTSDDLVPASIRFEKRTIPVKLRLKGDSLDHLLSRKWSFRIEVKGKDQIFGMRRFSIQHPKVRGFQGETLIYETMQRVGVITPRYFFVKVTVNGTKVGIMAVEEHFSKELLESNQRPEGVILRFDESLVWAARDGELAGFEGIFDDYRNAPIRPFRGSRVSKSEKLSREYAVASGLLRGFLNGTMQPSEVFDAALMGRFLAVAELWGSWHAVRWHNMRFYMNPISAKLEPIVFDATIHRRGSPQWTVCQNEPMTAAMLADRAFFTTYRETLDRLSKEILEGDFKRVLQATEERHLGALQKEFFLLRAFPYEELAERAELVRGRSRKQLENPRIRVRQYPELIRASVVADAEQAYVEIANAVPHEVEIHSVGWRGAGGRPGTVLEPLQELELPVLLPPRVKGEVYEPLRIPFQPPEQVEGLSLRVIMNMRGWDERWGVTAEPTAVALRRHPIPAATLEEALAAHPFLRRDGESRVLSVAAGRWQVAGSLVVPPGFGLELAAGTTLRFGASEGLIVHGPVDFEGTADEPVVLEGAADGSWQGIAVLGAGGPSHWRHVTVRNTTGTHRSDWVLTGGTVFYQSDIEMVDCFFEGNRAEDALNIIRSDYRLEQLRIVDAASDAFDSDFSYGAVVGGQFVNIGHVGGGDAIDVSGGRVDIDGARFVNIADKALSVGERSETTATGLVIEKAGVGAACKDGSRLTLSDSAITEVSFAALAAYVKKPELGPAWLEARNISYQGAVPQARAQEGSTLIIDGSRVKGEELDVDQLYETIMRPGLKP